MSAVKRHCHHHRYFYYILSALGIKPRTLCMLGKSSTAELAHSPWFFIYHTAQVVLALTL